MPKRDSRVEPGFLHGGQAWKRHMLFASGGAEGRGCWWTQEERQVRRGNRFLRIWRNWLYRVILCLWPNIFGCNLDFFCVQHFAETMFLGIWWKGKGIAQKEWRSRSLKKKKKTAPFVVSPQVVSVEVIQSWDKKGSQLKEILVLLE